MLRQLSESEARDVLASGRLGRLGCIFEGAPYVVPVSYILRNSRIYIHSMMGRKIMALRANPKVCLQVDEIRDEFQWRSAIASGDYSEVFDPGERARVLLELIERFPHLTPVESVPVPDGGPSVIVFCIDVKEVSGAGER